MKEIQAILDKKLLAEITLLDIFQIIIIFALASIVTRIITYYMKKSMKSKLNKDQMGLFLKAINYTIYIIAFIWSLGLVGLNLSGLMVAGGIAGIVIGFASQSIVGNLISGVFIMMERPIRIGEAVDIGGIVGIVENISIISTLIRDWDGLLLRIPNEKVFTSTITNFVSHKARRFGYEVGIRYQDDAEKAIEIIKQILEKEPFVLVKPDSLIFVQNLGDNAVNITVKIWAPVSEWYGLKQRLLWIIKKTLEDNGIEIAFPQRVVWLNNASDAESKSMEK